MYSGVLHKTPLVFRAYALLDIQDVSITECQILYIVQRESIYAEYLSWLLANGRVIIIICHIRPLLPGDLAVMALGGSSILVLPIALSVFLYVLMYACIFVTFLVCLCIEEKEGKGGKVRHYVTPTPPPLTGGNVSLSLCFEVRMGEIQKFPPY